MPEADLPTSGGFASLGDDRCYSSQASLHHRRQRRDDLLRGANSNEPFRTIFRCRATGAKAAGCQRQSSIAELQRTGGAHYPLGRWIACVWASSWRPRAAGARELQRVLRTVVRVLDGRAMRGSGQCPIASARGRIHRGKFGRAVAGRDATLAEALAPLEASVASLERVISTRSGAYDALLDSGEPLCPEPATSTPTDRAWLFYTSGTTGRPKGAVLTHRNLLCASQCYYADIDLLDERDTHLLAAPVSHGAGLYALPFLLKGAHQIMLPHFDVPAVLDALQRHRQVSMFAAPTMLPRLVHAPEVSAADLGNLRTIYYGGGPMYV